MVTDIDHRDVASLLYNLRRRARRALDEAQAIAANVVLDADAKTARSRLAATATAYEDAATAVERWARRRGLHR